MKRKEGKVMDKERTLKRMKDYLNTNAGYVSRPAQLIISEALELIAAQDEEIEFYKTSIATYDRETEAILNEKYVLVEVYDDLVDDYNALKEHSRELECRLDYVNEQLDEIIELLSGALEE